MKTSKKIFAAFLAVMMIALMIPFSASAAESYSYSIIGKEGYEFSVYKIADVDTTTFAYSNFVSESIEQVLTEKKDYNGIDSAKLLEEADKLTKTTLGVPVGLINSSAITTKAVEPGVYYVRATVTPASVTSVKNSVFALPYTDTDGSIRKNIHFNAGSKVKDDTPEITKVFTDNPSATEINEFIGKDISFTITSSVVGSTSLKLKSYVITDTMSKGLVSDTNKVVSVKLVGSDTLSDKTLENNTDYVLAYDTVGDEHILTVTLTNSVVNSDEFYSYSDVELIYTAKLSDDAIVGYTGDGNTNIAKLDYENHAGVKSTLESQLKKVYTFEIPVKKVDGNTNELITADNATFTLYSNADCTTVAPNGSTVETLNGVAKFTGLKAGTYYLKETAAPAGYNINSSVFKVVINNSGVVTVNGDTVSEAIVKDYPLTVPVTGGAGTIMFTIGGIALIACAGVLFLIVMRKKTSK